MTTACDTQDPIAKTLGRIDDHIQRIRTPELRGENMPGPGSPMEFPVAAAPGDAIAQGDVTLEHQPNPPEGYRLATPEQLQTKLTSVNGAGAQHCLDSLDGVQLWLPQDWPNPESLLGPWFIRYAGPVVVTHTAEREHSAHGAVTIPPGVGIQVSYAREWLAEQQREARARD